MESRYIEPISALTASLMKRRTTNKYLAHKPSDQKNTSGQRRMRRQLEREQQAERDRASAASAEAELAAMTIDDIRTLLANAPTEND